MEFTTIKIQLGESMAWVNLDRPEVRNALNAELIRELTEAFDWLNSRDDIRVVILKGNGTWTFLFQKNRFGLWEMNPTLSRLRSF